jgi:hypothetical protein
MKLTIMCSIHLLLTCGALVAFFCGGFDWKAFIP